MVRGYKSRIDGSIQPYGLVIPESYTFDGKAKYRLDIWFHGRGETLSEVNFLDEHMNRPGQFTPKDTIVLHPYGRYCNAFKFAGEVDVYEGLESTQSHYKIDPDRISVRRILDGRSRLLAVRRSRFLTLVRRQPGCWFRRNSPVSGCVPEGDLETDVVRAEALAAL